MVEREGQPPDDLEPKPLPEAHRPRVRAHHDVERHAPVSARPGVRAGMLAHTPCDAVFSDVVMPGMGGIALARTVRRRFPGLPVLLASGYSHVLAQDGAEGFELIHKPYSAEQLGRILSQLTARRPDSPSR